MGGTEITGPDDSVTEARKRVLAAAVQGQAVGRPWDITGRAQLSCPPRKTGEGVQNSWHPRPPLAQTFQELVSWKHRLPTGSEREKKEDLS